MRSDLRTASCVRRFEESQTSSLFPDRKSTRLNSSHITISYAVFCLKKKKNNPLNTLSFDLENDSQHPIRLIMLMPGLNHDVTTHLLDHNALFPIHNFVFATISLISP